MKNVIMPITIKELSEKLGLSRSTVSKALNNRFDVSEETRNRVLSVARDLDYQPSAAARNLRRQRTDKVGLVVNYPIHKVSDFLSELLPSIASAIEDANYNLILYTSIAGDIERIGKLCRSREIDGIVVLWPPEFTQTQKLCQILEDADMPFVLAPRRVPHPHIPFVATDHKQGAILLTEHLIELGHKRIGFISRPEVYETDLDRLAGYQWALMAAGLPFDDTLILATNSSDPKHAETALDYFLSLDEPVTAIMCFTDPLAIKMLALSKQRQICVPQDLSITGFDGILASAVTEPTLTTVRQPLPEIGMLAVETLLAQIEGIDLPTTQHLLPVELIVRDSTTNPNTT